MTEKPAADNGGTGHSQDWVPVKSTRDKIVEHGANVTTPSPEKQRQFVVSFTIKEKPSDNNNKNNQDSHQHNLAELHSSFLRHFLSISKGEVHFIPTSRSESKTVNPMTKIQDFPTNNRAHRNFFHRQVSQNDRNKVNTVKIYHTVMMQDTVQSVKKKMINFLQTNRLWMSGGELDSVETVNIAWLLGTHPQMVNRPRLEEMINDAAANLPNLSELCK